MILRLATFAMATRFELVLCGEGEAFLRSVGEAALEEIAECHRRFSRFEPGGLPARVAAASPGRRLRLDEESSALLALCGRVWRGSAGAFDPSVGALMDDWGVGGVAFGCASARGAAPGFEALRLDEGARAAVVIRPVSLDFGAVAKGFALDRAAAVVREHGVRSALMHGGTSSVLAIGAPDDAPAGWLVRVRGSTADATVVLRDASLGVSAPRGRTLSRRGAEAGHVLDPRTQAPARGVDTAAVVCGSAAEADAWSTALVVLAQRPPGAPSDATTLIESDGVWSVADPLGVVNRGGCARSEAA